MEIERQIESILLFKNEPVTAKDIAALLNRKLDEVKEAFKNLQGYYKDRGITIVSNGDEYSLGTHPESSALIESIQKEELSRELGRAGLETLAVILYRGPISRREIDQIRGVNSGFILRALLIRGLVERTDSIAGERSFTYKPTLKLLQHLGVRSQEELPAFDQAFKKMEEFVKQAENQNSDDNA
jgi:segregation and condensation protein B